MTDTVTCPSGCSSALPAVSFNKCAPDVRISEITHILAGKGDAAAFTDWTSGTEWGTRLDQSASGDKIRVLTVRASKPATTKTEQTATLNRKVVSNRHHVINILIDEMTDANYDFFRTTQCGEILFRMWFINNNTKDLYGGNAGIYATIFGEPIYDEGTGVLQKFVGTIEWDSAQDPPRVLNPITGL